MTDEGKGDTEKWIAAKGAKYAYGYDKGGKLSRYFGVNGIPHVVLIDANGVVLYSGGAGGYSEELLRKATAGALTKPLWEWTAAAKNVKSALLKQQFKVAIDEAAKLGEPDGGPGIKASIEGMVKAKVEQMKEAYKKGDFLGAETAAKDLQKDLAGLPEQAEAVKTAADIAANTAAEPVLKNQRQIAKIREKAPTKRKEIEAAIEDLTKIRKSASGTFAAEEADALTLQLRAALNRNK